MAELAAFVAERGLGNLERQVRLGGRLRLDGSELAGFYLCLTERGVWLVQSTSRFAGHALDLTRTPRLRYEPGRLQDRLWIDGQVLRIPPNSGRLAREVLALGRLRARRAHVALPGGPGGPERDQNGSSIQTTTALDSRLSLTRVSGPPATPTEGSVRLEAVQLGSVSPLAVTYLSHLAHAEDPWLLVAALGARSVPSSFEANVRADAYFAMSAQRSMVVQVSELGDTELLNFEAERLRLEIKEPWATLRDDTSAFELRSSAPPGLSEWLSLNARSPGERLYEAARRRYLELGPSTQRRASITEWLELALRHGEARAGLVLVWLAGASRFTPGSRDAEQLARTAEQQLRNSNRPALEEFAELGRRWDVPCAEGRRWLHDLERLTEPLQTICLELHRAEADRWLTTATGVPEALAHVELELAEHELRAGFTDRARQLATKRLAQLEDDESALFEAGREHLERARWFELLAREAERRQQSDVRALAALARLQQHPPSRIERLAHAHAVSEREARLVSRARDVLQCLSAGGLHHTSMPKELDDLSVFPLSGSEKERVRHPLARGSARLSARLSELIAKTPEPDVGFLKDYCEALNEERHPEAMRALQRSLTFLSLPTVAAYVSHGARSLGLRGFSSRQPFVLIGSGHLEPSSAACLHGREFDFAFAAELSHLAFGQKRVTTSEVLSGAAGKTKDALSLLSLLLPLLKEVSGGRAQKVLDRVSREALDRAAEGASRLPELFGARPSSDAPQSTLARANEELIAAHRLVQLTADRAGLLCARSLRAALRCMLLTRAEYQTVLATAAQVGLSQALFESGNLDPAALDLAFRVRALIAFYLSEDFDALVTPSPSRTEPGLVS